MKYKELVIGIDQSYNNTGISIVADGNILLVTSIWLNKLKTNTEKRNMLRDKLKSIAQQAKNKSNNVYCIVERIRLRSQGFLNIDYIKSIGALNAIIIDVMAEFNIPVFSVDTRCWKSQVIGTSKPKENKYGVPPEKFPTVEFVIKKGFENSILIPVEGRKTKGTFTHNGIKYMYNNDASDACGIAMFWFVGTHEKLQKEK